MSFVALILNAVAIVLGLWTIDRELPVQVLDTNVRPIATTPGGSVTVEYDIIRKKVCGIHVDRWLVDAQGKRFTFEDFDMREMPGPLGRVRTAVVVEVSTFAAAGTATYNTAAYYVCNPLHRLFPITGDRRSTPIYIEK